jgi:hypothetical protein
VLRWCLPPCPSIGALRWCLPPCPSIGALRWSCRLALVSGHCAGNSRVALVSGHCAGNSRVALVSGHCAGNSRVALVSGHCAGNAVPPFITALVNVYIDFFGGDDYNQQVAVYSERENDCRRSGGSRTAPTRDHQLDHQVNIMLTKSTNCYIHDLRSSLFDFPNN